MGMDGGIRIERSATAPIYGRITPNDVDTGAKRFGLDKNIGNLFITGDRVEISRVDESGAPLGSAFKLDFVAATGWADNQQHPDGTWYVNVDQVGGMRLYESWSDALQNYPPNAVALTTPSEGYRLSMRVVEGVERCLGRTQSWTLNTNRDTADITSLGDGFQKN